MTRVEMLVEFRNQLFRAHSQNKQKKKLPYHEVMKEVNEALQQCCTSEDWELYIEDLEKHGKDLPF